MGILKFVLGRFSFVLGVLFVTEKNFISVMKKVQEKTGRNREIMQKLLDKIEKKLGYEARICSICGLYMLDGYCFSDGSAYYCSDDCLHHEFSDEEWEQTCEEDETSYWTEWNSTHSLED